METVNLWICFDFSGVTFLLTKPGNGTSCKRFISISTMLMIVIVFVSGLAYSARWVRPNNDDLIRNDRHIQRHTKTSLGSRTAKSYTNPATKLPTETFTYTPIPAFSNAPCKHCITPQNVSASICSNWL